MLERPSKRVFRGRWAPSFIDEKEAQECAQVCLSVLRTNRLHGLRPYPPGAKCPRTHQPGEARCFTDSPEYSMILAETKTKKDRFQGRETFWNRSNTPTKEHVNTMNNLPNSPNLSQVWNESLERLRDLVREESWKKWLFPLRVVEGDEGAGEVILAVKDAFSRLWILDHFQDLIEKALEETLGHPVKVTLLLDEGANDEPHQQPEKKVVQLNFWPSTERAAPNPILRSALFGIVQRGRRELLNDELLASWRGVELIYSGERLNQNDLDVWLQVLHLHRREELGKPVYFTWNGLLKDLNRNAGGKDILWLKRTINRLTKSHVLIKTERYTYAGGLLHDWGEDEYTGRFFLTANPALSKFFLNEDYTRLHWEDRLGLTGETEYARWLHAFISTHQAPADNPSRIRLDKLQELCGSTISRARQFRTRIEEAMEALHSAGHVTHWAIDKERNILVYANC